MNIHTVNKSQLIRDIKHEIDTIKNQISSLKYIVSSKNEIKDVNIPEIEAQIQKLQDQKLIFKAQLKRVKTEIEKNLLEDESKSISKRLLTNTNCVDQNNEKICSLESEISDLTNQLKTLKMLKEDGYQEGITDDIAQIEAKIIKNNCEIKKLQSADNPIWLSIDENSIQLDAIKTQIFNLEVTTKLKCELTACKIRLKELHRSLAGQIVHNEKIQQNEEDIKSEMKNIIKDIIHSESFFKVQSELRKSKEILATLEALKGEGEEISDREINDTKSRIKELENQIAAESEKTKLQVELKEARADLVNLKSCLGVKGIEDVSGKINETEIRIAKLDDEIARITTCSLNIAKPISERTAVHSKETNTSDSVVATDSSNSSAALMTQELQKWLAENMINEALGADIQEVIISAALLNLTKTKSSLPTGNQADDKSTQNKITTLAIGACEKFCMTQVLQFLVSKNPVFSAAYGVAIIANHCILGDAQLGTLISKVKSFMISESIKLTGTAVLGTLVTGTTATLAAIPAGLYLAYNAGSQYINTRTAENSKEKLAKINPVPTRDLSAAAMDMVADLTVESIWKKICS